MSFLSNLRRDKAVSQTANNINSNLKNILKGYLSQVGFSTPIGSFGKIAFSASSHKIETFDNYQRDTKARIGSHEIMSQKPVLEYLGADTDTISFTMFFSRFWGVSPEEEVDKIRAMCSQGEAHFLILNNSPVGENKWIIESVGESVKKWDNNGIVLVATINVSLREYVEEVLT